MFDVAQPGIPAGPHTYMSESWQELFAWEIKEAKRIGLEVMSQNGPGYSGNGGPWITPDLASQKIVESTTRIPNNKPFTGKLPQPLTNGGFYRDVAVLAIQETKAQAEFRIEDSEMKRLVWLNYIRWKGTRSAPLNATAPPEKCIPLTSIINLTNSMKSDGSISWSPPAGEWSILRIGHTWTGQKTLPATPESEGPECDKLDKRGIQAHFNHIMRRMIELSGPEAGKTFHTFFVDSWEAGGQNWTENMPQEFKRRRGYDITPFLPILTGRVLGDLLTTERFLYDLRQTVSELVTENFWAEMQRLCHTHGMRLAAQTYITTGHDINAANFSDEPVGEFWSHPFQPNDYRTTVKSAASAANINGKLIVGAEAFTAAETERWLSHPATMKALGDQAFCLGANRFQFHRFAMQRFPQLKPGMTMGKWGQHYDSTQTWWEWSKPWHDYLARCQWILRQGPVVTDVLALAPEEPLHRFEHTPINGHDYDVCGPDSLTRLAVTPLGTGFPNGPHYKLITVHHHGTMSLTRLKKLRDLVTAGANLLGEPPSATPGLTNLPLADQELTALTTEIWGTSNESERALGKGRVFRGITTEDALKRLKVSPNFTAPQNLTWIHRRNGEMDFYFIATSSDYHASYPCTFRISGKQAELWNPETGTVQPLDTSPTANNLTSARIALCPNGSTFVVFRPGPPSKSPITSITLNGESVYPKRIPQTITTPSKLKSTFTYSIWAKPETTIELPAETTIGFPGLKHRRNDAIFPPPAHRILDGKSAFSGLSIGSNGVVVYEHAGSYFAPVLVHATPIEQWTHVAVSYQNGTPSLLLNGKKTHQGLKGPFTIHSPVGITHAADSSYHGRLGTSDSFPHALNEKNLTSWLKSNKPKPDDTLEPAATPTHNGTILVHSSGNYHVQLANGITHDLGTITLPASQKIIGPWTVSFPPESGAPSTKNFENLISWSNHLESNIRYFSGTATYSTKFNSTGSNDLTTLDLGRVEIMARVKLNGKDLGILWKPPYQIDISNAIVTGTNDLEISVVNLWVNRLIGDATLKEDSERDQNGILTRWPQWAINGQQSPTGKRSFVTFPLWKKNEPLRPSGLLGPVILKPSAILKSPAP
jgi:hypothetical protein